MKKLDKTNDKNVCNISEELQNNKSRFAHKCIYSFIPLILAYL